MPVLSVRQPWRFGDIGTRGGCGAWPLMAHRQLTPPAAKQARPKPGTSVNTDVCRELIKVAVYTPDLAVNLEYMCRSAIDSDGGATDK
jgi:hypothetical protein